MARKVTVNADSINLPDGNLYNSGDEATLTDEQFARISSGMFAGDEPLLTEGDYQSDVILTSPDGTEFRLLVSDGGVLSTEEIVD